MKRYIRDGSISFIPHFMHASSHSTKHILLIDGLFEPSPDPQPYGKKGLFHDDHVRCLCGHEAAPDSPEAIWISLLPDDEDYIIGLGHWIEGVPDVCNTCYDKAIQMEKMTALGG